MANVQTKSQTRPASRSSTSPAAAPRKQRGPAKATAAQDRPRRAATTAGVREQRAKAAETAARAGRTVESVERAEPETGLIHWQELPVVHMRVPVVRLPAVSPRALLAQTKWVAQTVRFNLPPADRLLYYGGLVALAAVGVVDWPIAAAVGAGVWIATRARQAGAARGGGPAGAAG